MESGETNGLPFYVDTGYGFPICGQFSQDAFRSALHYKPRPDDLFIVTYPKCGTTWVQNIVACIYREGKPFASALEFLSHSPFLEMTGAEAAETMKRPGAIKLHLPFHLTPWSKEAKYIFVARNPKDCVVSFYHHTRNLPAYKFQNGRFDDYFELFIEGRVDFGDYFDTLVSWYQKKDEPNVLFITYEQLKEDTKANVLKIAHFMGQKYKDMLLSNEGLLNDVIHHSSFDFMKENLNRQMAELSNLPEDFLENHPDLPPGLRNLIGSKNKDANLYPSKPDAVSFVRKGIVGDFKNHLSPEQNERIEKKMMEKTKGTNIMELWKDVITCVETPGSPKAGELHRIFGLPVNKMFSVPNFISAVGYKPRPDDVFVTTYPKCGTTWTQQILLLLFHGGKPPSSLLQYFMTTPFLELAGAEAADLLERPNAIKTHLPYYLAPRSSAAKYIYVTRNPKDCCVSYYHHHKNVPGHSFEGDFDVFFEHFIDGNVDFGDYFDHLLGWYAHRNDPNVLFVTYEELKEKPEEMILKMASFLDDKKYAEPLRNDPAKLKAILQYTSFQYMKEKYNKFIDEMFVMTQDDLLKLDLPENMKRILIEIGKHARTAPPTKSEFIRKGIVGDWRNHFSEEQNRRMNEKFARRTAGTDIPNMFKMYM